MRTAYIGVAGAPEGKRPAGTPRHICEDNIKMVHKEAG
jgi:hypothetical protein